MDKTVGMALGLFLLLLGWVANFYLWGQWVVYPKQRRRFRVCKPYLAVGWVLWFVGGSVLQPLGRDQSSGVLRVLGGSLGLVGIALTIFAVLRLLRSNTAERRAARDAARQAVRAQAMAGTWPPPPREP